MKKNAYLIVEIGEHQFQECKESFAISKVSANQFDAETLRIRFQIKPGATGIEERFKLVSQGRFIVVRFDTSKVSHSVSAKVSPVKKQNKILIIR